MVNRKEIAAMLLAGGQGSRLKLLTENIAKPAVPFGGKYRIIDFPLSNCINSGIDTVGVLTQYQPLALNEYIGNGQPWDLDRSYGGVMMLPPYQAIKRAVWYKGTANAIYQNLHFLDKYQPEYVAILSGDHIYKMDYGKMLDFHKKMDSACTIAVLDVPLSEAGRFGILNTNEDLSIYEFEEKPKNPKSTKASMGVYIFTATKLYEYLMRDEEDPDSQNDFGKNIIPSMLNNGEKMYAYKFDSYWKDVGTINSLWEANMDLLGVNPSFSIREENWKIYSRNYAEPPHFAGEKAVIQNSLITEGCEVYGTVINSVLSGGVTISEGAVVRNSVLHGGVTVGGGSQIDYSIIDVNTRIGDEVKIGVEGGSAENITLVGEALSVRRGLNIPGGAVADRKYLEQIENKECAGI